jgi:hypothetical protein
MWVQGRKQPVTPFLTHKGVAIYHVYKEDIDGPSFTRTFHFSTDDDGYEFGPNVFDVRGLPTFKGTGAVVGPPSFYPVSPEGDQIKDAIRAAIDQGLLT